MAAELPRDAASISDGFLSDVMGMPVTVLGASPLDGGNLSEAYRVRIAGPNGVSAPQSVVVKLPCLVEQRREFAIDVDAYEKEVGFYRRLATEVPLRSPLVYGCLTDGTKECGRFAIVMEDLTAHSVVFDQIDDPPDEPFVRRIALEAAALHASYWEAPVLDEEWLSPAGGRYVFSLDALSRVAASNVSDFLGLWREMYGSDLLDASPAVAAMTTLVCGDQADAILDHIYDTLSSRPRTLLHGDMRADNVFRSAGAGSGGGVLTFIDWQVVHAGPPGPEFTQAWMHSLEPDVRRRDHDVLAQYHACLTALEPQAAAYSYTMLVEDYRASFCFWWMALISLGAGTLPDFDQPESDRMKRLWDKGMHRALVAMTDLDCLGLVRSICDQS